jgi:hypothetical protein
MLRKSVVGNRRGSPSVRAGTRRGRPFAADAMRKFVGGLAQAAGECVEGVVARRQQRGLHRRPNIAADHLCGGEVLVGKQMRGIIARAGRGFRRSIARGFGASRAAICCRGVFGGTRSTHAVLSTGVDGGFSLHPVHSEHDPEGQYRELAEHLGISLSAVSGMAATRTPPTACVMQRCPAARVLDGRRCGCFLQPALCDLEQP